jgi:tryptophan synthase alpha chain
VSGAERLKKAFDGKKAFVAYVTCGDPSLEATVGIVCAAARAGADVIELGVPFSEPSADGPVVQRAMERALARGGGLLAAYEVVRQVRAAGCDVPILLFGYFNPVFVQGVDKFIRDAVAAGADGALVVDLPIDELEELAGPARAHGFGIVPLAAPTSTPERLKRIAAMGAPFVYYVSLTGVTGAALQSVAPIGDKVAALHAAGVSRVAVGFGIVTPADARNVAAVADGVVVGSAIVRAVEENPGKEAEAVAKLVGALRAAV